MPRRMVVAGSFYPANRKKLEGMLRILVPENAEKSDILGAVSPHAGYVYSGAVAGKLFSAIKPADTFVVLSPNHTGYGERFAISVDDWETPLGEVKVDRELADRLLKNSPFLEIDPAAHAGEHSVEVQLPFVQLIAPKAMIVPITMQGGNVSELLQIASALAKTIKECGRKTVVVVSSDMTHYEPRDIAKEKDKAAIEKMLELDPEGLFNTVRRMNISMCGYVPATVMLAAVKELGAKKAELIAYGDSGEATGDASEVVGYAGIIVY